MKNMLISAFIVAATQGVAHAASEPVRGGMCYSPNALLSGAATVFNCDFIGRVKDIKEIYEKGFRVVSSGFVPKEAGGGISSGFYVVIEERR
jgi:hypothetical protein